MQLSNDANLESKHIFFAMNALMELDYMSHNLELKVPDTSIYFMNYRAIPTDETSLEFQEAVEDLVPHLTSLSGMEQLIETCRKYICFAS